MLFYRTLENENIDALKQNHGDFDAWMELSVSAKSDLLNGGLIKFSNLKRKSPYPTLTL